MARNKKTRKLSHTYSSKKRRENLRKYLFARDSINGVLTCSHCSKPLDLSEASIDHIIPISLGGTNKRANLRFLHKKCNHDLGKINSDSIQNSGLRNLEKRESLLQVKIVKDKFRKEIKDGNPIS